MIVGVVMSRSHIENGFTDTDQNSVSHLSRRPVTVAVNTTVTVRFDSHFRERVDKVLTIGERDFRARDGPDSAESTCAAEEQKLREIV